MEEKKQNVKELDGYKIVNNAAHMEEEEIHLYDFLEVILRRKWIVIIFFVTLVTAVTIYTYKMTPIYKSDGTILIEDKDSWEGRNILTEFAGQRSSKIQSNIEVIKSRTNAEKVVKKLHYDQKVFDISRGLNPQITKLIVPDKLIDKTFVVKFQDKEKFVVINSSNGGTVKRFFDNLFKLVFKDKEKYYGTNKSDVIGSGSIDDPFTSNIGLSFTIKEANANNGSSFKIKKVSFDSAVNQLMSNTSVSPIKNTNVVRISAQDSSKQMAADMANSIVAFYREYDIKARSQQASQVIQFIEGQLNPIQEKVNVSMSALAEYKSSAEITDIGEGIKALINNVADLEKEKAELVVKKYQVNSLYNELQRNTSSVSPAALSFLGDPVILAMISRLTTLETTRESFLADYTEKHPQVVALSAEINQLREKTHSSIMNISKSLNTNIKNLSLEIEGFKNQLKKLPAKEKELADLIRNVEVTSRLHKFLMEKRSEANIMYASTLSQTQIIDKAVPPSKPVKPNKRRNIMLAIMVSLFGGVGLAFFIDYMDNTIKSPHDVESRFGLPIFGRIPFVPANKPEFLRTRDLIHSNPTGLITAESTKSITAESLRSLRTNLQFAVMKNKGKIFHFTSPESAEGKTTIAANLAITLALMGSKTLIIDLDLRKPKIHHIFGISKEPGITNLLTRKATLEAIKRTVDIEHLFIIPSGIIPPNPSELLNQQDLSDFLNERRKDFDYIIIDSPPVLPVTDSQLLGRLADATFLIVEPGKTKYPAVEYAIKQLRNVDVNVAGVIINKGKPSNGYGYNNYNNYYYYGDDTTKRKKSWFKRRRANELNTKET